MAEGECSMLCLSCQKTIRANAASIQCTNCKQWTHSTCADISKEELTTLKKALKIKGIKWICSICEIRPNEMEANAPNSEKPDDSQIERLRTELLGEVSKECSKIFENLIELIDNRVALGNGVTPPEMNEDATRPIVLRDHMGKTIPSYADTVRNFLPLKPFDITTESKNQDGYREAVNKASKRRKNRNELKSKNPPRKEDDKTSKLRNQGRKAVPIIGQGAQSTNLKVVKPYNSSIKRVFVSRLDPNTTEQDIVSEIKQNCGLGIKAKRLNTRFDTYSSFCIEADKDSYATLMSADTWGEGVLILPFFGKFQSNQD